MYDSLLLYIAYIDTFIKRNIDEHNFKNRYSKNQKLVILKGHLENDLFTI